MERTIYVYDGKNCSQIMTVNPNSICNNYKNKCFFGSSAASDCIEYQIEDQQNKKIDQDINNGINKNIRIPKNSFINIHKKQNQVCLTLQDYNLLYRNAYKNS